MDSSTLVQVFLHAYEAAYDRCTSPLSLVFEQQWDYKPQIGGLS